MGRTPLQILHEATGGWPVMSSSTLGEEDRPNYMTFEQRVVHWHSTGAVRTLPFEINRMLILVALRASHELDRTKLAQKLEVEPGEIRPALPVRVRAELGFEPGFETIVTDEDVPCFLDVRVTWLRGATIAMGTQASIATLAPERLIEITGATVGDFAIAPTSLDPPEYFPDFLPHFSSDEVEARLREAGERVTFPLFIPPELLHQEAGRWEHRTSLFGCSWSAGLGSPVTDLDRATISLSLHPGGWPVYLDESPSPAHQQKALEQWPRLEIEDPWTNDVELVMRDGVGILLAADERFPGDLRELGESLVKFQVD